MPGEPAAPAFAVKNAILALKNFLWSKNQAPEPAVMRWARSRGGTFIDERYKKRVTVPIGQVDVTVEQFKRMGNEQEPNPPPWIVVSAARLLPGGGVHSVLEDGPMEATKTYMGKPDVTLDAVADFDLRFAVRAHDTEETAAIWSTILQFRLLDLAEEVTALEGIEVDREMVKLRLFSRPLTKESLNDAADIAAAIASFGTDRFDAFRENLLSHAAAFTADGSSTLECCFDLGGGVATLAPSLSGHGQVGCALMVDVELSDEERNSVLRSASKAAPRAVASNRGKRVTLSWTELPDPSNCIEIIELLRMTLNARSKRGAFR